MKLIPIKLMPSKLFTAKDRMEVVVDDLLFSLMIGDPPIVVLNTHDVIFPFLEHRLSCERILYLHPLLDA
jgi:hypothetical protein